MADNTVINPGTGGDVIATDDVAGVKFQRMKVCFGADGTAADVAASAPLPATQVCGAATVTSVAASTSSVALAASNAARRGLIVWNDSAEILYVKCGTGASTTSYTWQVPAGGWLELPLPCFTGAVEGAWAAADGNARVTELT